MLNSKPLRWLAGWVAAKKKRKKPCFSPPLPVDELTNTELLAVLAKRYETLIAAGLGAHGTPSEVDVMVSGTDVNKVADLLQFANMATAKAVHDGLSGQSFELTP